MNKQLLGQIVWRFSLITCLALYATDILARDINYNKANTRLTVASSNNFPPVNLLDASGQLTGFSRDISSAVANELGRKLKYKHSPGWSQVLDWLRHGEADLIHNTGYTIERDKFLDYTQAVLEMNESVFVKNDQIDIHNFKSLIGKKVLAGYSTTEILYIVFSTTLVTALLVLSIGLTLYLKKIKQAHHSLSERENNYRTLIDKLPQSVFLKDRNSVYISCNQNYARTLGISPQEIVGKTDYDFHKEQAEVYRAGDRDVVLTGKTSEFTGTYLKNGQKTIVQTVKFPVYDESGKISGVIGICLDITENYNLQQKLASTIHEYNAITDTINDIIYKLDMQGNIIWWNKQFEEVTGFRRSEHQKIHFEELVAAGEYDYVQSAMNKTFMDGFAEIEVVMLTTEGEVPYLCNGTVLKNDAGDIIGLAGVGRDIRKQKQQEHDRKILFRQLQQAQKMEAIGHLTGGIAHDFNNLLAIIMGNSELALDYCENRGDQKLKEYLTEVCEAGDRGQKLISQMLAFSRSKKVEDQTIQFESCIREDIKLINSILPSSIQIKTEIEPGLPAIQMNRTQLNQVIMNLAINARDAMNGRGTLTIQLKWLRDLNTECIVSLQPIQGDWLALSVTDTGNGIDPKIIKQIFNPFYTTKEVGKGSGMGLSVIYGIMRNHGGHILLETEQGKGTTFRLLFSPFVGKTTGNSEMSQTMTGMAS